MKTQKILTLMIATTLLSPLAIAMPVVHPHTAEHPHPTPHVEPPHPHEPVAPHVATPHPHETVVHTETTHVVEHNAHPNAVTVKTKTETKSPSVTTRPNTKSAEIVKPSGVKTTPTATHEVATSSKEPVKPSTGAAVASVKKFFSDQTTKTNTPKTSVNGNEVINLSTNFKGNAHQAAMVAALVVQTNNAIIGNSKLSPKDIKFNQTELEKKFANKDSSFYTAYVNALTKINQVKNLQPNQELFGPHGLSSNTKIIQGSEGDCFFLSAINGLLKTPGGPEALKNMISRVPGKPNQFEVTFPNGTKTPVALSEAEIGMYSHVEQGGKWLAILSAAEAKRLSGKDPSNPYKKRLDPQAMMNGGYPAQTLRLFTGKEYTSENLIKGKTATEAQQNVVNAIANAQKANLPLTISTDDHVLAILNCENCVVHTNAQGKVTSVTGDVLIKNPWGSNHIFYDPATGSWSYTKTPGAKNNPEYLMNNNGEFKVPIQDITKGFAYITYPTESGNQ